MYRRRKIHKGSMCPYENRRLESIDENEIKRHKGSRGAAGWDGCLKTAILEETSSKDENIPASQEPAQRYLSQRSINDGTLSRTQSRPMTQNPPNTYFDLVLTKVGVRTDETSGFVLTCDHMIFAEKLRGALIMSQNYPENIETFKIGIRNALNLNSTNVRTFLNGCVIMIPGEEDGYQSQDSMMVSFFMIDFLREFVLNVLLDKIEDLACENYRPNSIDDEKTIFVLLLSQLRYVALLYSDLIYKRMILIFGKCSLSAKWLILGSSDSIFDSRKHDDFVQILLGNMSIMKDSFDLNAVQALMNLNLNSQMQNKLRHKMFELMKDNRCPGKALPCLMKFTLKILNEDSDEYIKELISNLRAVFLRETTINSNLPDNHTQVVLFDYIEQGLMRSKRLYDLWQKEIDGIDEYNFRCIDFFILVVMIKVKEERTLCIENMIRRRIVLQHIKDDILQEAASKFHGILELQSDQIIRILSDFLRDKHKIMVNFVKASFGIIFGIGDQIQKMILRRLLNFTCDKSSHHIRSIAVGLLQDLQNKYSKEVQKYGSLLGPLLDRINEMSLQQTRLVMRFLCAVAYPAPNLPEYTSLQDQIDIVLKKQLISHSPHVKKQGIVGSARLIYRIVEVENDTRHRRDYSGETFSTVNDLPEGNAKIAAQHVVRVCSSAMHCPISLALFYSELATIFTYSSKDQVKAALREHPFTIWLCELTTFYFQNSFVVEHSPTETIGIELSYQKCINTVNDVDDVEDNELPSIAINIAERVLMPSRDAASSVIVLIPLFNLVRVLHLQRYNGSLELINALLGCAIILPSFFDDPEMEFNQKNSDLQEKILDIYFYCANWIREIVTSFITQRESMIRRKVLMRLSDLMRIEERIREIIIKVPNYMPPLFGIGNVFCVSVHPEAEDKCWPNNKNIIKSIGSNDHRLKKTDITNHNCTRNNLITTTHKYFESLYGPREIYRQMDSNVMLILRENFSIQYPLPEVETSKSIGLLEYRFILNDLVTKLEIINGLNETSEDVVHPLHFMMDLSKFLGYIGHNMDMLAATLYEKLSTIKFTYGHVDLYTERFNLLKINFGLSFRLLAVFFSWFQHQNMENINADLLKDSLTSLLKQEQDCTEKSSNEMARHLFKKYQKYNANIMELQTAVYLYRLLLSLQYLFNDNEKVDENTVQNSRNEVRNLCKIFLMRKWHDYDGRMLKGSRCNLELDELVSGFLKNSDFRRQREILGVILEEAKCLTGKDSGLKSFPNFRKVNSPLLFKGLCKVFTATLNMNIANMRRESAKNLHIWEESCELLNMQLEFLQTLNISSNFQFFLKHSHIYLKLILHHGLPIFEQLLSQDPERISKLLKNLQVTTRFLHCLCCHSKALKNTAVLRQIPALRQTVETLVFRVKALVAANNCTSVFWMGNLRKKDLHGDELLAQASATTIDKYAMEEESDDERIPSEDESAAETLMSRLNSERSSYDESLDTSRNKSSSRSKCF